MGTGSEPTCNNLGKAASGEVPVPIFSQALSGAADAIAESRAYCRRVARRAGSSFYPCFALLKSPKREAMEALYAFLRHTDDLADGPAPLAERRAALNQWREAVMAAISNPSRAVSAREGSGEERKAESGKPSADTPSRFPLSAFPSPHPSSLIPALADAVQRFHVPPEHLLAVFDGVQMDLDGRRYETFDELAEYCHKVASAVGLACIHIWGFRSEAAFEPARRCGLAFQLTNILRDLKEDVSRRRIYLPLNELRECGYSPDDLLRGVADQRFDRLMAIQIGRARRLYHEGAGLFDFLEPDGRRVFGMMTATYHALLQRIARRPRQVVARRVRLGRWQKLRIAARWMLLPPRRSSLP
jgi:phytoene synthase